MSRAHPPKLRDTAPERPRAPREPTREEAAATRKLTYDDARAAVRADPSDETKIAAWMTAKKSYENGRPIGDTEYMERRAIELLTEKPSTAEAVEAFAIEFSLETRRGYSWIEKALSGRFLGSEAARYHAIRKLESTAHSAELNGDFASSVRARVAAAKLAGVKEPATEVRLSGSVRVTADDAAPEWTRRDNLDPRVASWIFSQTRVIGDTDVIAYERRLAAEDAARPPVVEVMGRGFGPLEALRLEEVARGHRTAEHGAPTGQITVEGTEIVDVKPPEPPPHVAGSLAWLREHGL